MSDLFNINWRDLIHSLVGAVIGAVLGALQALIANKGFNLTKADAFYILSVAVTAALTVLSVKFGSDHQGKLGGRI